jgi:menaquinol-cytochrome c reductase cytochrome b/c subunit
MTEVPEHLLKRAQAAKDKAAAKAAEDAPAAAPADAAADAGDSRIPAHLLERSKAAKAKKAGGGEAPAAGAGVAVAAGGGGVATMTAPPLATGPGGHTQRLLTVVKSGSIQDVKAKPQDKVHVWPHLLIVEFVAALFITAFTTIFSIFVNAPLL